MATMEAQETTAPSTSRCIYHVFLSFRGEDTRKTFTDHLYEALVCAGLRTFRDNDELERGEDIKLELPKAIQRSRISVVVLSDDYASSKWCLDELVMILQCKRTSGHLILPVFYRVDPTHFSNQTGIVGEAFSRHKEWINLQSNEKKKDLLEKVKGWKEAVREIVELGGVVLQNQADGHESKFIQKIVTVITDKLSRRVLSVAPHPIGLHYRTRRINSWVQDGSTDVGIMVICGMGGIGKTTIAKCVFNLNFSSFAGSSFLANVREASEQPYGLVRLQRQLLSDILRKKIEKIFSVDEGIVKIKHFLSLKKVLLVLDDVDQVEQLDSILGMRDWFFPGSKIIITTRQDWLLKPHEVYKLRKVERLDDDESLKLFSWHAFGQADPIEGYVSHSKRVVQQCGGLPLALRVLGSSLGGKKLNMWENALEKLEIIPENRILEQLRISFESLQDDHDRSLFLHIASFFVGMDRDYVVRILDECDFYTIVGIQNLIDASLLTVGKYNKLAMHQLLQDMGRDIVRQESPFNPGKRSRLWRSKDSFNVLVDKTGTGTIEGIVLDMRMLKENMSAPSIIRSNDSRKRSLTEFLNSSSDSSNLLKRHRLGFLSVGFTSKDSNPVNFESDAFEKMYKLRILKLNNVRLAGSYEAFPNGLKYLCWRGFPLKSIPSSFPLKNLVAIDMRYSNLKQLWQGTKVLQLLKMLNLSHSHDLTTTPDFSGLPNLERLILKDCTNLVEVHESIGNLKGLILLNLKDCRNLKKIPREIGMLKSLQAFVISGCSSLDWLPTELSTLDSLKILHADGISINQVLSTSEEVQPWHLFIWSRVSKPRKPLEISWSSLPNTLVSLSLVDCNLFDDSFSMDFSQLSQLESLNLSKNPICSLPESISRLTNLQMLDVESCTRLKFIVGPSSIKELSINYCSSLEKISYVSTLSSLPIVSYSHDHDNLVEIQGRFKLEPFEDIDAEMLDIFRLCSDSMKNIEVKLDHFASDKVKKLPIQGVHQRGVFSIFLPGNNLPSWFSNKTTNCSLVFTLPALANRRIRGLNVCSVYTKAPYYKSESDYFVARRTKIKNRTKRMKWIHKPSVFGIPEGNEDMTWLSHWKFGNLLEEGDEVKVSVCIIYGLRVKELGIHIVYDKEEEKGGQVRSEVAPRKSCPSMDVVPGNLSARTRLFRII